MIHFPDLTIHSDVFQRLTKCVFFVGNEYKNFNQSDVFKKCKRRWSHHHFI